MNSKIRCVPNLFLLDWIEISYNDLSELKKKQQTNPVQTMRHTRDDTQDYENFSVKPEFSSIPLHCRIYFGKFAGTVHCAPYSLWAIMHNHFLTIVIPAEESTEKQNKIPRKISHTLNCCCFESD